MARFRATPPSTSDAGVFRRSIAALTVAALVGTPAMTGMASADNKMGYQLETQAQASALTRAGGSLGMRVGPEQEITSQGLTFELLKVEAVGRGSPAEQAGLSAGDRIIAVNGHVFSSTATFAAYVGSVAPGRQIEVDYIPAGGGPDKAQRLGVTVGEKGQAAPAQPAPAGQRQGLSTGEKVAIGLGAAAVFGCYETNCFARLKKKYEEERAKYGRQTPAPMPAPAQQ